MASGFNGQQFAFHGYLPIDSQNASAVIRVGESPQHHQTILLKLLTAMMPCYIY